MTQSPDKTATDATTEHVGDGVTENRKRKERDDAAPGADALVPKGEDLGGNEEDEEEHVVTLSDVIQEDAELSETADAVLGDASETNCSFPMGYYRQVGHEWLFE
ncbi:TPA: hypothetical protein N0F65_007079 [Lagenidium giganteum]|uniref:Uncharacterized protein n=1 Tax=Lagenidium giganteum TaxID=4803 RepID=A0AAV2YU50_9STRA|nr:TPA: hypothetical protein N0F65_007079 [Lagenidium giganteum]